VYSTNYGYADNITRMFWEGEKRRASEPTDNIHRMPRWPCRSSIVTEALGGIADVDESNRQHHGKNDQENADLSDV